MSAIINRAGLASNTFLGSHLIRMFASCGSLLEANQAFSKLHKPNLFTWSAIISANAKLGHGVQAINLYLQMQGSNVVPDGHIFSAVLKACGSAGTLLQGKLVHVHIIENEFERDVVVGNTLIDMYSKCDSIEDACKVFNNLPRRDIVTWSAMIVGFCQHGGHEDARQLFQEMQEHGMKPNGITWNAIIAGYAELGHAQEAFQLFLQMQEEGIEPNDITFVSIIKLCSGLSGLEQGQSIHVQVIESGCEQDTMVGNVLIDMYAKCGSLDDAHRVFTQMLERDVVTWTAMIASHAQHGQSQEAIQLFQQMRYVGIVPNSVTFVSILKAYSSIAALDQGKLIHTQIIQSGFDSDVRIGCTLTDMYTQCGGLEDAQNVFSKLSEHSIVTWNAIIAGYAEHNNYKSARQCFEEMQQACVKPNIVTFVSLLSACSHVGLVDEGRAHFRSMREDHGIIPIIEHYNCLIDLLGRAGQLRLATDLLKSMPFPSNLVGWKSLLGHCRIHGNVSLAAYCFDKVVTADHRHAGGYVHMTNTYVDAGNWQDAARVRELRRGTDVWKEPGKAFIEVDNKVYDFMVGDKSHTQSDGIYTKVKKLSTQMKEKGFAPNFD